MRRLEMVPRSVERHGYVIPTRVREEGISRGRVLLVGDAAGFTDPITLEGISRALRSGRLAGAAIAAGGDAAEVRRRYGASVEEEILKDLRPAARMARLLYGFPRVRTAMFGRQGQRFAEVMTEVASGRRRYRDVFARTAVGWKLLRMAGGR